MLKYILLRDKNFNIRPHAPPAASIMGARTIPDNATPREVEHFDPVVETEDLKPSDIKEASRDPSVLGVAPVFPTKLIEPEKAKKDGATATTLNTAWGINAVGADSSNFDGSGIKVAVLDTGIDATHGAFQGVNLIEKDFTGEGNGDNHGHGTHCAGTIFGRDVNGTRIGIARGVSEALIGKVLGSGGGGTSDMLFNGIQWASNGGARVISMSLGFDFPGYTKLLTDAGWPIDIAASKALEGYRDNLRMFDALMQMINANIPFTGGAVVIAASGNESRRQVDPDFEVAASLPAAAQDVISVGALQKVGNQLSVANFSNTKPTVSAPGVNVISAKAGGGLVAMNGTSMACPHTAGVAALWWHSLVVNGQVNPTAVSIGAQIRANADPTVFAPGVDIIDRGEGIVRAPQ